MFVNKKLKTKDNVCSIFCIYYENVNVLLYILIIGIIHVQITDFHY